MKNQNAGRDKYWWYYFKMVKETAYLLLQSKLEMDAEVTEVPNDGVTDSWYWDALSHKVIFRNMLDLPKDEIHENHADTCYEYGIIKKLRLKGLKM